MTPLEVYQQALTQHTIEENTEQLAIMQKLQNIYYQLIYREKQRLSKYGKIRRKIKPRSPVRGLYLWGEVGVGKTFLMDIFYECLPTRKIRRHFHHFMQDIHDQLRKHQGEKNPLRKIGKEIADNTVVICFDEFIVNNIADAMVLSELFRTLFQYGVCLIASSNSHPDDLYKNGLHRQRFLPAIEIIKQNVDIAHLHAQYDYRRRELPQAHVYFVPADAQAENTMEDIFSHLRGDSEISTAPIELFGRFLQIKKQANDAIWFNFQNICGRPRSQKDYLALSKQYRIFFISDVPIIKPHQRDLITSFIYLVDVLYDNRNVLIMSAAALIEKIYPEGPAISEFARTCSRIIEMQSEAYLQQASY